MTDVNDELMSRLAARATEEGLVDVAYTTVDSPVGSLLLAATSRGLVRVGFPTEDPDDVLEQLADRLSGRRHHFDVALDWELSGAGFRRKVLRATARIPFGEVRTYRQMAVTAGSPRAYRAAGNALGSNPIPVIVPCHRVLASGGGLGGYGGGLDVKQQLLQLEGVPIS